MQPGARRAVVWILTAVFSLCLSGPAARCSAAPDASHSSRKGLHRGHAPKPASRGAKPPAAPSSPALTAGVRFESEPAAAPGPAGPGSGALPGHVADLNHSYDGLRVVVLSDGSKFVDLQGRFLEYSVARVDASGKIRLGCVSDSREAAGFFRGDSLAPAAQPEEK